MEALRNLDLLVLLRAFPSSSLLGAPLIAWVVAGGAWVVGRIGMELADRSAAAPLADRNRNAALGVTAFADDGPRLAARRRSCSSACSTSARPASPPRSSRWCSSPLTSAPTSSPTCSIPRPRGACDERVEHRQEARRRLRRLRAAPDRDLPDLRQRRQERRVPAAERVHARPLDRHPRSAGSTCRSTRPSSTSSSPRSSPASRWSTSRSGCRRSRTRCRWPSRSSTTWSATRSPTTTSTRRWPPSGSRSWPRCSSSSSSRTSSA